MKIAQIVVVIDRWDGLRFEVGNFHFVTIPIGLAGFFILTSEVVNVARHVDQMACAGSGIWKGEGSSAGLLEIRTLF